YMKSFYEDDESVMLGIKTKEIHTGYVTAYARELAAHLQLTEHDIMLSELIGLFHDVGRFRQWTLYRTFADAVSEDHADLGLKVIRELPFFSELSPADQSILLFAIGNHNKKDIAPAPDKKHLLFARIIRDADKLDIFRVLEPYLTGKKIQTFSKIQFEDEKMLFAPGFVDRFVRGEQVDYNEIRTNNDRILVRLMWAYDINFAWTMIRIREKGYLPRVMEHLPQTDKVKKGYERLDRYVEEKCNSADLPVDL
ncbi:MAG: HD domain-containing protein, partial [Anaerovibrio sp.]|uniref:HD domain-containing protein n=1 Tax=Anaerovibrio sp. TaxID=1872532 RepID=UPI0025E73CBF